MSSTTIMSPPSSLPPVPTPTPLQAMAAAAAVTTTTTSRLNIDCRKFSPNIFNKSKCSHCFRQREEHSAAALECNRASRKVSKCGYLFVAPDWDFSNPLYRTKRWQRRWFVLYDDGELTYSVDEHPETVPQACIDMTKVLDVQTAEDMTGHTYSIAITAPDRVTFVKGTCSEESKWWLNILIAFPKAKGRHKRHNTAYSVNQINNNSNNNFNNPAIHNNTEANLMARNCHNSYHKDTLTSNVKQQQHQQQQQQQHNPTTIDIDILQTVPSNSDNNSSSNYSNNINNNANNCINNNNKINEENLLLNTTNDNIIDVITASTTKPTTNNIGYNNGTNDEWSHHQANNNVANENDNDNDADIVVVAATTATATAAFCPMKNTNNKFNNNAAMSARKTQTISSSGVKSTTNHTLTVRDRNTVKQQQQQQRNKNVNKTDKIADNDEHHNEIKTDDDDSADDDEDEVEESDNELIEEDDEDNDDITNVVDTINDDNKTINNQCHTKRILTTATTTTETSTTMTTTNIGDENDRNVVNELKTKAQSSCLRIENIGRDEKTIKDLANTITNLSQQQKNRWTTTAINNALNSRLHHQNQQQQHHINHHNKSSLKHSTKDEKTSRDETDYYRPTLATTTTRNNDSDNSSSNKLQSSLVNNNNSNNRIKVQSLTAAGAGTTPVTHNNLRPESLPLGVNSTPAIVSAVVKKIPPVLVTSSNSNHANNSNNDSDDKDSSTSSGCIDNSTINNNLHNNRSKTNFRLQQLKHIQSQAQSQPLSSAPSSPPSHSQSQHQQQQRQTNEERQQQQQHLLILKQQNETLERGDPDGGCNLDDLSSNYLAKSVELRVNTTPTQSATTVSLTNANVVVTPSLSNHHHQQSQQQQKQIKQQQEKQLHQHHIDGQTVLNAKKGWLMKQDNRTGDWSKHWFTLTGAALFYYRDPVTEERGVLDGVLDVNSLTNINEVNANRNYAFQLITWDKRRLTLASLSPSSRNSWIAILRNAAGIPNLTTTNHNLSNAESINNNNNNSNINSNNTNNNNNNKSNNSNSNISKLCTAIENENNKTITPSPEPLNLLPTTELIIKENISEIEKDFLKSQQRYTQNYADSDFINTAAKTIAPDNNATTQLHLTNMGNMSPKCSLSSPITLSRTQMHFSSDEEYRTASEGGRRDSIGDWGSPQSPSPPIPIPLSLMCKTKEQMRIRSPYHTTFTRLHKRSHSSPPSSRRSTVDSVGSDDIPSIHTVEEEHNLNLDKEFQFRLSVLERERDVLRNEAKERETRMSELLNTLERTEQELNHRIHEMEEIRENLNSQLEEAKRKATEIVEHLTDELDESNKKIKNLEDRLTLGIEENENLYKRLRELESYSPASFVQLQKTKLKRLDSLSDLTQINDIDPFGLEKDALAEEYSELKGRFEKAVNEIRAMKKELKESQNQYDSLEISYTALKQDFERQDKEDQAQFQMMAARIQDLTLKYSLSEKQVRTLKQKLSKSERRRSLSLKGKEQITISKELELKLLELENKIDELEKLNVLEIKKTNSEHVSMISQKYPSKKSSRRRSLESNLSGAVVSTDSLQFLVRVNDLEKRCDSINNSRSSTATPTPISSTPNLDVSNRNSPSILPISLSEHLFERLRCLENVLISSKDRLEQSLSQLQQLRSSRTRRSVSPITERKDSYRFVERNLHEVVKLIGESTTDTYSTNGNENEILQNAYLLSESSPVKMALTQLETQLRSKLADLLQQRRILRERNELTKRKDLELLAERIAFESVCFGKLRDSVNRAENPKLFTARQTRAEVAETAHLMSLLKAKLQGKYTVRTSGSLDILAGVLARRLMLSTYHKATEDQQSTDLKLTMEPIDQNILEDLLRQQNEINVIVKHYKNNAMENLAINLAAETLSYISPNDLVQGAVREAWRQAQETVNAELVQSEIAHIMMRNAERLENALLPSFGYTLTAEERLSFEKFADAVHDVLRREMDMAVSQLTQRYEEHLQQMKRDQRHLHLQPERKSSEGRQLLSDFADIVAHKALVDARIDVLRGEYVDKSTLEVQDNKTETNKLGIIALQKYENLFEELSSDLQINNPDDILLEADFEFTYKQRAVDFLNDRQVLSDISTFLKQLEDSLIALQCEATTTGNEEYIPPTEISIESLQDVCNKCCDLRQRADQLLQQVHRKLNAACQHCLQVRDKLHSLKEQHENEILRLKQTHTKDLNSLMQQIEHQRSSIRLLELETKALTADLHKSEELIEEREREIKRLQQKLDEKEEHYHVTQAESTAMIRHLHEQNDTMRAQFEKKEKLERHDDEYEQLLKERDYLLNKLTKEQERSLRYEKRLELLELEHQKQMECVQQAYSEQIMAHCMDFSDANDEESFRQRYQLEIEQLRTLCEKGLTAMESSHRRTINDLEEKHKQEIERLLIEKDQALAEETQATLAALDAMRKAHQSEVQREVTRFKQEFLTQYQQATGEKPLHSAKAKEEELYELRQEILSFSEKYSIKCVENAALEEKLRIANQKLKHFQQMQQLELRNKQFRAHLASDDPTNDIQFVQGLFSSIKDQHNHHQHHEQHNDDDNHSGCQDSEV